MATKWGIASAGKISHDFVLAVTETLPKSEHEVVAVAARDKSRAAEFAKDFNIPTSYGSYEELAKDTNIEVVYIGAINTEHFRLGKLFLNHGKHVLCEKPLTMNKKDSEELLKLAQSKNLFFMEAIWVRFFPAYAKLNEILKSGELGDIVNLHVNFGVPIADVPRVSQKDLGGSAILDIGIYAIQFALFVFGKPKEIKASGHLNAEGVDQAVSAIFSYPDGKLAILNIETRVKLVNEAKITGTKGTIVVPAPFYCTTKLVVNDKLLEFPLPEVSKPFNFINSCGLRYQADEVRRCLKEKLTQSPVVSHDLSLLIADIMDQLRNQIS